MVIGKDEKVYFADHEAGPHPVDELEECFRSESVRGHVEHEIKMQRELDEEERIAEGQRKNKNWWQFWI